MDRIRSLLLARTHVVVMDPDVIASAATRPSSGADVELLEDELAQLGFVLSLDLASVIEMMSASDPARTISPGFPPGGVRR